MDFWYLYGIFGTKIRTENFLFPDSEFLYLDFWGLGGVLGTKIHVDIKYFRLRSSTYHMFLQ